ncbi:TonB family protein [Arenimonas oryziterrae]|uniref:energy transducer TonB n=1 Tax=Arenimonas oryziterrae TaxID=498055 RepID=UPI0006889E95
MPAPGPTQGPTIGPSERLSATLALSLIAFGVVILGIGFAREDAAPVVPTLDVILTQTTTPEPPKQADFIAQANNQGGGDRDKAMRPRDPQMGLDPKPQPGVAPQPMTAQAPPPAPEPEQRMLTTTVRSDRAVPLPEEQPNSPPAPLPTGRELVQRSLERARLAAEMERQQELYAKRPKRKFISASTQQYEYAAYMRAWVEKVERVGNLNCPANVCTPGLVGSLIMTVVLRPDGTIAEITITTPSGIKALDQAAIKAVRLAQPFAPIPKTAERVDELFITRTWLLNDGSLDTK